MSYRAKESHPRHKESRKTENVLVLQGGGSLGAFACGVFKALVKKNIRTDIAGGTSIGAVNAAIIVGSKSDHPEEDLEEFWIELAESSPMIIPDTFMFEYDTAARSYVTKKMSSASANAAIFGVPKMFVPRWNWWNWDKNMLLKADDEQGKMQQQQQSQYFFDPRSWTYLYDHSPLAKTLDKYIDYKKLNLAATQEDLPSVLRLI
jgi:NTE family protein